MTRLALNTPRASAPLCLSTPRLLLRPLTRQDISPQYVEALNDSDVVGFTEARHVSWDRCGVEKFVEANEQGTSILLGVFLKTSSKHIGNIRLFNVQPIHHRAEVSFLIFDKSEWSKGYATEALGAVTRYAFETLTLHRLHADYYALNAASAQVFRKAGFVIEGVFKDHFAHGGRYVDSVRVAKMNPESQSPPALLSTPAASIIPSAGPSITEREVELVAEAVREGWYANMNHYLDEFEQRFAAYTGMKHALATTNCTSAIHLAMLALGIGPGDEVIVPDITWVASAAPICYVGAKPVLVDIDRGSWCMAPEAFQRAITKRTKAVVVVGLLGNLPDMDAIRWIADRHHIPIIEDAAESIGATYKGRKAGTFGTIGVFSFNGTKLMVTGEGGMFVTNSTRLYRLAKGLAHHGLLMRGARSKFYWSYRLGYKYKMTNMQAAMGLTQLSRLDELVESRRRLFHWYAQRLGHLEGAQLNQEGPHVRSTFWITTAMLSPRYGLKKEALAQRLMARKIPGRPFFYPLSAMPPFAAYARGASRRKVNPVAYAISPYGICLPSAFSLTEAQVAYVCEQLIEILEGRRKPVGRRPSPLGAVAS